MFSKVSKGGRLVKLSNILKCLSLVKGGSNLFKRGSGFNPPAANLMGLNAIGPDEKKLPICGMKANLPPLLRPRAFLQVIIVLK